MLLVSMIHCKKRRHQTWCHRCPVETPSIAFSRGIRFEEDIHGVGLCGEDRWQGVAAARVHQCCSVPIHDFDGVALAGDRIARITRINCKAGELQLQQLPALCLYPLCLLKSARITPRVVWRANNTCGKQSLKLNPTKGTLSIIVSISPLTLGATAFCWTKRRVFWLPEP